MGHHVELEVAELFPLVFRGDCSACVEHLDPNKSVRQVLCKEREANKIELLVHKGGKEGNGVEKQRALVLYVCIVCVCTKAQRLPNKTKALRSKGCVLPPTM